MYYKHKFSELKIFRDKSSRGKKRNVKINYIRKADIT